MDYSTAFRSAAEHLDRTSDDPRSRELAQNLAAVHERIDRAVRAAGRTDRPELIVVTKNFPAADVVRLYELGVRDVGENRDQEAAPKAAEVGRTLQERREGTGRFRVLGRLSERFPDLFGGLLGGSDDPLRWHFVGQLQSNKARSVIRYAQAVHALDRPSLLKALVKAAARQAEEDAEDRRAEQLDCLIQVDLEAGRDDDHGGRGGAAPEAIAQLAEAVQGAEGLRLAGLMAVAPLSESAREAFTRLAGLAAEVQRAHPGAAAISAGMSADLEEAVAAGATHLRIGRDVLGDREYPG